MANNNNAPYYRTVPSSPEQDEDAIILGEEDMPDEMSPEVMKSDQQQIPQIGQQLAMVVEDEEEAVLRRRLMEKKLEKERQHQHHEERKTEKEAKTRVEKSDEKGRPAVHKQADHHRHQKRPTSSSAPPKREPIVWKKETDRDRKPTSSHGDQQQQHRAEKRGRETTSNSERREKTAVSSSTTVSVGQSRVEKKERHGSEQKSSSNSSADHRRKRHEDEGKREKDRRGKDEVQQEIATKRPRQQSNSSSGERGRKKAQEAEEKQQEAEEIHEVEPLTVKSPSNQPLDVSPEVVRPPEPEVEKELEELAVQEPPEQSTKKPKKYSKFESSPEQSDEEETAMEEQIRGGAERDFAVTAEAKAMVEEEELEDEEDMGVEDDLPENKEFDQLTDQDKAILSPEKLKQIETNYQKRLISQLPVYYPGISGCRSVVEYECLNKISEGTFGVVYRAQERRTDEIVALKRLKMEKEHQGFPITSLREINMLLKCGSHPNVLNVREVVVGSSMDKIYMVMEYVEHDLKSLMELKKSRNQKWTIPQVKTLLHQLIAGVEHMHNEYVIHRDLKTSNLLLSHRGILKIGDFGLAREFGEPIKPYTPVVVTLWYRSPELLLGTKLYSTPVDMWSVGCIFGEFLKLDPMFPGRTEIDQLQKIFKEVGSPNEDIWPGCMQLPGLRTGVFAETPYNQLRRKFASELPDDDGYELLNKLLALDPNKRLSASAALGSKWFKNDPKPLPPSSFPTWPAKSEHNKKPPNEPMAPRKPVGGFTLKFDVPKF